MKAIIEQLIKEGIERELDYIREYEQIKSILTVLEGKPLNGVTLSKKRLSAFDVENGYTLRFAFNMEYSILKANILILSDIIQILLLN